MVFDFYPWKIDVDVEKTKRFYQQNDFSSNKEWNRAFAKLLDLKQQCFFADLGIDLMKIEIDKREFEDNEEVPFIYTVNFLMCGCFLRMPKEQLDLYCDAEVFGDSIDANSIGMVECEAFTSYEGLALPGTGVNFKHPATYYDGAQFETWDCGFINGAMIVRG